MKYAITLIKYAAAPRAHVFYGQVIDSSFGDRIQVTVIATGFPAKRPSRMIVDKPVVKASEPPKKTDYNRPAYVHWTVQKLK